VNNESYIKGVSSTSLIVVVIFMEKIIYLLNGELIIRMVFSSFSLISA